MTSFHLQHMVVAVCLITGGADLLFARRPAQAPQAPAPSAPPGPIASLPAAWQDVIRNLRNPDAKVRLSAVEQLGSAGYTAAAEYVAPLVTDPDDRVQYAAIDAELTFFLVESISGRSGFSFTGARSRAQEAFAAGPLVRTAVAAPPVLLDHLAQAIRDENARIRFDAIHTFGVLAAPPLSPAPANALLDGLDHFDPVIRAATARVLGRLRVAEAGDKLVAALNDSNEGVRAFATEALGLIREPRAVDALSARFAFYQRGDAAAAALLALARIANPSSSALFRARLTDGNAMIRRAAVEGLGRLGDQDSLPAFKTMMASDKSESVRLAAAFAIQLLDEPQSHVIATSLGSSQLGAQARDYLLELGPAALPGVKAALGVATDGRDRADLIHVLGFVGSADTIPLIESFAKDKDERVRRAAANAIARLTR